MLSAVSENKNNLENPPTPTSMGRPHIFFSEFSTLSQVCTCSGWTGWQCSEWQSPTIDNKYKAIVVLLFNVCAMSSHVQDLHHLPFDVKVIRGWKSQLSRHCLVCLRSDNSSSNTQRMGCRRYLSGYSHRWSEDNLLPGCCLCLPPRKVCS